MKKIYFTPKASFELLDNDKDIMTASQPNNNEAYYDLGGGNGEDNRSGNNIGTMDGGESLAKGDFAFCEDFEYSIDM